MKEKLKNLPPPLRKQVLLRFAGAGACFVLFVAAVVGYRRLALCLPFLGVAILAAVSGALLVWRADRGKILVLEGVCREVKLTPFRRSPKALVMECGGRQVKVYLRARTRNLVVGERLRLYVADSASVYEEEGGLVLGGYLALERA